MGRPGNVEVIDRDTGEVLVPGMFVYIAGRKKVKEGFFMGFLGAFELLAKDEELRGQPLAVLLYLFARLDWENHIAVSQSDIATALNMGRNRVSESMAKLVKKGILDSGPKLGRSSSYRLNPHYGWRGSVVNLEKARKVHLQMVVDNSAAAAADAVRDTLTRDMFDGVVK